MSARPQYTLVHAMVREITSSDGVREDVIRAAGHSFELRRSTVADAKAIEKIDGNIDKSIYMLARATRMSIEEIAYMDLLDMKQLGEVLQSFTEPAKAGSTDGQTPKISSAA